MLLSLGVDCSISYDYGFEGIIQEEKVDCFNLPYYTASIQEVKTIVEDEGSFIINRLEAMELYWDIEGSCEGKNSFLSSGEKVAKMLRFVVESMLSCFFGIELMDELFGITDEDR
ncbi:hypothetical protein Nepgr_019336 [Nepenthes gracilis]|uniref:Uncharacterized protein n=1 Tax=Nepenthes gracilis TaxID=150966 RepID=A0AAD3STC9_NEPGR|nr:hypothetical protein Nepgr_019336 [Nepenthes gracilis]